MFYKKKDNLKEIVKNLKQIKLHGEIHISFLGKSIVNVYRYDC